MTKDTASLIVNLLANNYPDARPALEYSSSFELLIAVILSAQCTDKRVNIVTRELFKEYNTPYKMVTLTQQELESKIKSCGLYRSKAKHILSASADIIEKFNGQVPDNIKDLKTLSGVGQKTANVVFSVWFKGDAIAVDTHVFRVSNRIGLANAKNVTDTEKQLNRIIDKDKWSKCHHYLIYHGRNICKAQKPLCEKCNLKDYCKYYNHKG